MGSDKTLVNGDVALSYTHHSNQTQGVPDVYFGHYSH